MSTKRFDQNQNTYLFASGKDEPLGSQGGLKPTEPSASAETWIALCARAAVEQDPKKLLDLVIEINRLLDTRRKGLATDSDGTPRSK